jgi:CRP-like cAMP-binding protein
MNSYDPISYCSNNPLFREVNKDGIKQIAGQMRSIEVKKGNIIYFQGDRPASVYFIRTGSVKLSRITPEGRELTFSILGKNDIFGVTSVLLGNQRPTAAEAVVDCLLYQMYRSQFLQMLKRFPSLAIYLTSTIG